MQLYYFCKQKKNFIVMMQIRKMWVAYNVHLLILVILLHG